MRISPAVIQSAPGIATKRLLWSLLRRRAFDYDTVTPQGWRIKGNTRDWIQRMLFYFGRWEPHLTAWMQGRLQPGDAFIDVGANIGYFTLLASDCVGPQGRVVAIEAMPAIFQHLSEHIRLNHLDNVRLLNMAAAGPDSPPQVQLFWGGPQNIGSSSMIDRLSGGEGVTVRADTLSRMLDRKEISQARLIKVDVEGMEAPAIRGLQLENHRLRPDLELIIEMTFEDTLLPQQQWLLEHMRSLQFHPYLLPESHRFRDYAYPERIQPRAQRLKAPLQGVHNVIFSRIDADDI